MTQRAFRFGVQVSRGRSAEHWTKLAQEVESLGYATFTMPDHFTDQLAPVPALMAAAQATTQLRIGALVFANDYKHPLVLAKEVATMDLLSNGRMEIGLGAGWTRADYDQAGMTYDRPSQRIERLGEALQIFKGLMADGPYLFTGQHYRIQQLEGLPKPVQRPHPPLLIGGGAQKILTLAAQQADIVGVNVDLHSGDLRALDMGNALAAATEEKIRWIQAAAGQRFDSLELQVSCYWTRVGTRAEAAPQVAAELGVAVEQVLQMPHVLVGSIDEMVDTLLERRERYGFSYVVVPGEAIRQFAPVVERLAGR